jgi:hypothetical protein
MPSATTDKLQPFLAPFKATGELLRTDQYALVPFQKGSLKALPSGKYPPLNLGVTGISTIAKTLSGSSFLSDLEDLWNDLITLDFGKLLSD